MAKIIDFYGGNLFNFDNEKENYKQLTKRAQIENIGIELRKHLDDLKDSQKDIKNIAYENFKRKAKVSKLTLSFSSQISIYQNSLELQRKAFLLYLLELRDSFRDGNLVEDDFLPDIFK